MRLLTWICMSFFLGFPMAGTSALLNGGFETGGFDGWTTIGDASIQTAAFGAGPAEGIYDAFVTSGTGSASTAELEEFFGLSIGALNAISPSNLEVINGSAIAQTITASAGDTLEFDWNFLTQEVVPEGFINDFAFYVLSTPSVLVDFASSTFVASGIYWYPSETGFMTTQIAIPADGTYLFGIGVVNVLDTRLSSALLVDNVQLTSVPLPASLWLFMSGMAFAFPRKVRKG